MTCNDLSGDRFGITRTVVTPLRALNGAAVMAFSLVTSACGSDSTAADKNLTRPEAEIIQVQPFDMTTAFGSTPMQLLVYNSGSPAGDALLDEIARAISLTTWPEQDVIATTSTITDTSGKSGEDQYAHVHVSPSMQLEDRWYALRVADLPKGVRWSNTPNLLALPGGAYAARFRTGSGPVVAGARVNAKGSSNVYLDFSEKIRGDSKLAALSSPEDHTVNCEPEPIADSADASGDDAASFSIHFECQPPFDLNQPMQIDIQPGLESVTGQPLADGIAVSLAVPPTEWVSLANGDKVWKPAM